MRMRFVALAVLAGSAAAPAFAEFHWRLLWQRDLNVESDALQVIAVAAEQRFSTLRLCVSRQPIRVDRLEVRFRDGSTRAWELGWTLQNQRCTGDFVLSGGARALAAVAVSYHPGGLSRRGAGRRPPPGRR